MRTACEVIAILFAVGALISGLLGNMLQGIFLILVAVFVIKLWQIGEGN